MKTPEYKDVLEYISEGEYIIDSHSDYQLGEIVLQMNNILMENQEKDNRIKRLEYAVDEKFLVSDKKIRSFINILHKEGINISYEDFIEKIICIQVKEHFTFKGITHPEIDFCSIDEYYEIKDQAILSINCFGGTALSKRSLILKDLNSEIGYRIMKFDQNAGVGGVSYAMDQPDLWLGNEESHLYRSYFYKT